MSHRFTLAAALVAALALPAGPAGAQTYLSPGSLPAAAASLGYTAAPATADITRPALAAGAEPATTGSIRSHHPARSHVR